MVSRFNLFNLHLFRKIAAEFHAAIAEKEEAGAIQMTVWIYDQGEDLKVFATKEAEEWAR